VDEAKTTPDGIVDRVLMRVRTSYPRTVTREELNSDPLVGGRVAGIQKSLQRLVKKGLVEVVEESKRPGKGGKPVKHYKAVLARGEGGGECPIEQTSSPGTDEQLDNSNKKESCPIASEQQDTPSAPGAGCPVPEPLQEKGSAPKGQPDTYPHARTEEEINSSMNQDQWN